MEETNRKGALTYPKTLGLRAVCAAPCSNLEELVKEEGKPVCQHFLCHRLRSEMTWNEVKYYLTFITPKRWNNPASEQTVPDFSADIPSFSVPVVDGIWSDLIYVWILQELEICFVLGLRDIFFMSVCVLSGSLKVNWHWMWSTSGRVSSDLKCTACITVVTASEQNREERRHLSVHDLQVCACSDGMWVWTYRCVGARGWTRRGVRSCVKTQLLRETSAVTAR